MSHSDPFSGMAAFITAAQCESFSQAGRKLAQTPSAISKSISRLEESLGVKLFNRSPRLIALTPEGEVFYEQCKELLTTAQDARAVVTGQHLEGSGHLRVCLPISVGNNVVAPALPTWLEANPNIVDDYRNGKKQAIGSLIGQAKNKNANANPKLVRETLLKLIEQA